jgi:hypothetical protein
MPGFVLVTAVLLSGCETATDPVAPDGREPASPAVSPFVAPTGLALNAATGYAWRYHARPFDFLFDNHFDTHQQTKTMGQGGVQGFFYITFTGNVSPEGAPEAMHGDCNATPDECSVGWMLHGAPTRATLLDKPAGQHPIWCVAEEETLPQKGYSHFHWLGQPTHAHGLVIGQEYDGFMLKLTARDTFFFDHHGGFLVTPGIDTETCP